MNTLLIAQGLELARKAASKTVQKRGLRKVADKTRQLSSDAAHAIPANKTIDYLNRHPVLVTLSILGIAVYASQIYNSNLYHKLEDRMRDVEERVRGGAAQTMGTMEDYGEGVRRSAEGAGERIKKDAEAVGDKVKRGDRKSVV